ncbi:MAG: hypothetical protein WKG01_25795 [Kofleriaceae bacterium]
MPGLILESLRLEEAESRVTAPRPIAEPEPDEDPPTHEIRIHPDKHQTSPPPGMTRGPASARERDDAASAAISRGIGQAARARTASGRESDAPVPPLRSGEDLPTRPRLGPRFTEDPSRTEPSMPKFEQSATLPPPPNVTLPGHAPGPPSAPWSTGLAARIDAKIDSRIDPAFEDRDEWGKETPVVAPTKAELRSLLGMPDPTRRQSLDELEALHRATTEAEDAAEPEILQRRPPSATAEVDPDDIEAAIEVAPRARQRAPSAIAVAKKPKQD